MGNGKYLYYFYSPTADQASGACLVYHRSSRTYIRFTQCQSNPKPENGFEDNYLVFEAPDSELVYLKYAHDQISGFAKGYDLATAELKARRYFLIMQNHHGPLVGTLCHKKTGGSFVVSSSAPKAAAGRGRAQQAKPFLIELVSAPDNNARATWLCLARRFCR